MRKYLHKPSEGFGVGFLVAVGTFGLFLNLIILWQVHSVQAANGPVVKETQITAGAIKELLTDGKTASARDAKQAASVALASSTRLENFITHDHLTALGNRKIICGIAVVLNVPGTAALCPK